MNRPRPPIVTLTTSELGVLECLCRGLTNTEIATRLCLSETTVKTHVSSILRKLSAPSRLKAVVRAFELGLVRPPAPPGSGS